MGKVLRIILYSRLGLLHFRIKIQKYFICPHEEIEGSSSKVSAETTQGRHVIYTRHTRMDTKHSYERKHTYIQIYIHVLKTAAAATIMNNTDDDNKNNNNNNDNNIGDRK